MSLQPIPETWRLAVISALRSKKYEATTDFLEKWQNDFPSSRLPILLDDFEIMLSSPLHGCLVTLGPPARLGETWEFWLIHESQKAYAKILLRADGKGVVLYSAHLPKFRYLKCELS